MSALATAPLLTPGALASLVKRLPARVQADLRSAPKKLERALAPLYEGDLTREAIGRAAAMIWEEILLPVTRVLRVLGEVNLDDLARELEAKLERELERIEGMPLTPEAKRAARRAATTYFMMGAMGMDALNSQGLWVAEVDAEVQRLLETGSQAFAEGKAPFIRGYALTAAVLHGGSAQIPPARLEALADLADIEAFQTSAQLAQEQPSIRAGWYFEGAGTERFRSFALWAEPDHVRARRVARMVDAWSDEDADAGSDDWRQIREGLEANRLSSRPLFR